MRYSPISSDGCMTSPLKNVLDVSRKFQLFSMFLSSSVISSFLPKLRKKDLHAQLDKKLSVIKPDWINLHNFHGADWPMELAELSLSHSPTSWTLHDCSTFWDLITQVIALKPLPPKLMTYKTFGRVCREANHLNPSHLLPRLNGWNNLQIKVLLE